MRRKTAFSLLLTLIAFGLSAQMAEPVKWKFESEKTGANEYELIFKASIDYPWHLYSAFLPENGPIATKAKYEENDSYKLSGEIIEVTKAKIKYDEGFQMDVGTIEGNAEFRQKVVVNGESALIKGEIEFQVCDDANCLPPTTVEFSYSLEGTKSAVEAKETVEATPIQKVEESKETGTEEEIDKKELLQTKVDATIEPVGDTEDEEDRSLWAFFWISFGAGLLALLTPCVFPMIPMTVSFFMQGNNNKAKSIFRGAVFGISIMAIYTLLGLAVSLTGMGADSANALSTHPVLNAVFFALFVIFAFSFLGMFELVLPSKWVNKADAGADKGGIAGAFFMALTTVLVSFSCTGPIVGSLLVEAAGGLALKPILGMFGFGLAFAIPFTLFAMFPSLLKGLPKSGGWLNAVKVVLGFLVLAFSFKFLQVLDPTHKIISRELVLAIWTIIFVLMGMYLLGKLKFAHDSDLPHIKVPRLLLAITSFVFAVFMFMGLFGAPLKTVSALLPPKSAEWIDMTKTSIPAQHVASANIQVTETCTPKKYTELFHTQYDIKAFYDLDEGIACAKESGKPIFLDFTGLYCSNCKKMENNVWSDPEVQAMLKNDFVMVALYTDSREKLPEDEWYTSEVDGKVKKTIGQQNIDFEISNFKTNSVPLYVILDSDGNVIHEPKGTDLNVSSYLNWMKEGLAAF